MKYLKHVLVIAMAAFASGCLHDSSKETDDLRLNLNIVREQVDRLRWDLQRAEGAIKYLKQKPEYDARCAELGTLLKHVVSTETRQKGYNASCLLHLSGAWTETYYFEKEASADLTVSELIEKLKSAAGKAEPRCK